MLKRAFRQLFAALFDGGGGLGGIWEGPRLGNFV